MKQLFLFVFFVTSSYFLKAQCSPENTFSTIHGYYVNNGVGIEAGLWPIDKKPFGVFGGMLFLVSDQELYNPITRQQQKSSTLDNIFYARGQFRINRFTHITGLLGLNNLDNLYSSFGMRFSAPINTGRYAAFILEPQATNQGFKVSLGFAISLE